MVARAMAKEAGFMFLSIKNVRDMWVGASERNLSHVLNLIRGLTPCCVFMDELDQSEGSRGTNLDSGVGKRIFGELLRTMSDPVLIGKVLWVGASNRPDLIDQALKRSGRFDDKCLFLPPSRLERLDIFQKMFNKRLGIPYEKDINFSQIAEVTEGLTGADIELVVRRSYQFAKENGRDSVTGKDLDFVLKDFIPSRDAKSYEYMALLGLKELNSWRMLPDPLPPLLGDCIDKEKKQLDMEKLDARIIQLQMMNANNGV
jgi:SpoVK/Ycf46/Vps4 family AAA+-type ATPase